MASRESHYLDPGWVDALRGPSDKTGLPIGVTQLSDSDPEARESVK